MSGTSRRELSRCHEPEAKQEAEGGRRAWLAARPRAPRPRRSPDAGHCAFKAARSRGPHGPRQRRVADPHGCGALFVSCHSFTHSFVLEKEGCHQSPYSMLRTGWAQGRGPPPHAGPGPARTGPGGKRTDREPRGGGDGPAEPRTGRRGRRKQGATGRGRDLPAAPAPERRPRSAGRRPARGEPWRELSLSRLRQSGPAGAPASLWTSLRRGRLPRRLRNGLWHPPPSRVLQGK